MIAFALFLPSTRFVLSVILDLDNSNEGIDCFCSLVDENEDIPPLSSGKKWLDYKLTAME